MNLKTIKKLNKINSDFYKKIAQNFSDSRNYFWVGWDKILPHIKTPTKNILDVGCGNGRFAEFLINKNFFDFFYNGLDNNSDLLNIAKTKLSLLKNKAVFHKTDIVENLIKNNFLNKKQDLIVVFGVMHHIPSFKLRKKLMQNLVNNLKKDGVLALTFWQFVKDERFIHKQIDPQKLDIDKNELEENDFILDWQRGQEAFRYFHHSDEKEQQLLLEDLKEVTIIDQFFADGKTNDLNKYIILKKNN